MYLVQAVEKSSYDMRTLHLPLQLLSPPLQPLLLTSMSTPSTHQPASAPHQQLSFCLNSIFSAILNIFINIGITHLCPCHQSDHTAQPPPLCVAFSRPVQPLGIAS